MHGGCGTVCVQSHKEPVARPQYCDVYHHYFARPQDKSRYKCLREREKPVCDQVGAVQCRHCDRWFRSRRGLAVYHCRMRPRAVSVKR